jgi:hypothetical protein
MHGLSCQIINIHVTRAIIIYMYLKWKQAVAQLVEVLSYNPKGRGFD